MGTPQARTWALAWRLGAGACTLLLAVALSGCWLQPSFGPEHARSNPFENHLTPATVGSLDQAWSVGLGSTSTSEPLVSDGRVYLTVRGDGGSSVRALRLSSGSGIWQHPVEEPPGFALAGGVTFSGDLWLNHVDLAAAPCPFRFSALDPATGDVVVGSDPVNFPASGLVTSGGVAAYTESTQCFQIDDVPATLVVQDTATHTTQWTGALPRSAGSTTISDGLIHVSSGDQLYAFAAGGCGAATCDPLWVRDIAGARTIVDGRIFSVTHRTITIDPLHDITAEEAVLNVYAADTGALLWQTSYIGEDPFHGLGQGQINGIAVAGDTVYVAAARDLASAPFSSAMLDAYPAAGCGTAMCQPAWRGPLPAGAQVAPVVGGGVVYAAVGNPSGSVVAFDAAGCGAATCAPLVTVPVPGAPTNMSLAAGTLLVTSSATLTAYRAP